jgi:hypothetical protein
MFHLKILTHPQLISDHYSILKTNFFIGLSLGLPPHYLTEKVIKCEKLANLVRLRRPPTKNNNTKGRTSALLKCLQYLCIDLEKKI